MPAPMIAAGLVLAGVLLGVALAAKVLPARKVLYPVEAPPRPCADCQERAAKAAATPPPPPAPEPEVVVKVPDGAPAS